MLARNYLVSLFVVHVAGRRAYIFYGLSAQLSGLEFIRVTVRDSCALFYLSKNGVCVQNYRDNPCTNIRVYFTSLSEMSYSVEDKKQ